MIRFVDTGLAAPARLALAAMPGRFEPYADFIGEAALAGVDLVVCLAPRDEIAALAPRYFDAIGRGDLPFRWLNLPMRNYGLPDDFPAFRDGLDAAARALRGGETVLLHCAAGIGRTGTAAACLLKHLGLSEAEALERVRRAGSNPENAVQSGLVQRF